MPWGRPPGPHQHFIQEFVDKSHVAGDGPLIQGATVIAQESGQPEKTERSECAYPPARVHPRAPVPGPALLTGRAALGG